MNGMLKHLLSHRRAEHAPGFYGEIHLSFESRAFKPLALQSSFPEQSSFPYTLWVTNSKLIHLIVKIYLTAVSATIATGLKYSAWKDAVNIMICKLKVPDKFSSLMSINQSPLIPATVHLHLDHTGNLALQQVSFKKSCYALKYYQEELDAELFRQIFFRSCLP